MRIHELGRTVKLCLAGGVGLLMLTLTACGQKSEVQKTDVLTKKPDGTIAASNTQVPDAILGDWYGESKCLVPEPCHDEVVIYHLARSKDAPGKVHWAADKIVNGKPDLMGEFDMDYDVAKNEISVEFKVPRTGDMAVWRFKIDGDKMDGTLSSGTQVARKAWATRKKP